MSMINKNQHINQSLPNDLTKEEIELLLVIIKDCTFKGEKLELLYNLVLKLQNLYIK